MLCLYSQPHSGLTPVLPPSAPWDLSKFPVLSQLTSSGTSSAKPGDTCWSPAAVWDFYTRLGSSFLNQGLAHGLPVHLTPTWVSLWTAIPLSVWRALLQTHSCSMKELIPVLLAISIWWLFISLLIYSEVHCRCAKSYWLSQPSWRRYWGPRCEAPELFISFQGAQRPGSLTQVLGRKSCCIHKWKAISG